MIRRILQAAPILCVAALISACAEEPQMMMLTQSPFIEQDMKLKIKGRDAKDALDSNLRIVELLDDLDAPSAANIKGRINKFLNGQSGKLAGLGGIQSRAALEAAIVTLDGVNFGNKLTTFTVKGQIQESVWGESGFYYEPGNPMHMWVQMVTTATRTTGASPKVKRWAEMFRIEVPAGGVVVEAKNLVAPGDVFPAFGSNAFPVSSTMANGFEYKLWAVGNDVKVTDYWIDPNYDPATGPDYKPNKKYTKANSPGKFKGIFEPDDKACIDMMFVKDPAKDIADGGALDNGELPSDAAPPYYCLGRCQTPPVVNTR